ncbi:MAG: TetR/AcrR family transcriptional regulator [Desulfopila sp.]|jgi:AcrR family transcriptional regulator|nr:TetR/AcrR family transcriptional regulator [Desulfopila sp.]
MARISKKNSILEAATYLFSAKGFSNTSMTEVATLAEISGAAIFYHFKTKEDLFVSVLESVQSGILTEFSKYVAKEDFHSGLDMLLGAVAFHLHLSETKKEWFVLLDRYSTHELAADNRMSRQYLQDIYNCLVDIFEKALIVGQQDGSIRELSSKRTALIIFAMVDGIRHLENINLYHAGSLYSDLVALCRNFLENN